jgi:SAM-dependent methyltransferase
VGVELDALVRPPNLLTLFLKREDATPSPSGILVRRELLSDVGGFEESFRGMHEDQAFYAKACLRAAVYVSGKTSYRYRQHPDSCCADSARRGKADAARLTFWNWLEQYLARNQADAGEPWNTVTRLLEPDRHPLRYRARLAYSFAKRAVRRALRRKWMRRLSWGSLRRSEPISRVFGADRGQGVDRFFIERFLSHRADDIRGHVLEIGDGTYTHCFGGTRVTQRSVLHAEAGNPHATLVGNLETGDGVPADTFDCLILTQTLQHTYDIRGAVQSVFRCLRPGGVVLATVPGISQISRYDMDRWGDFWRFTTLSAERLFSDVFGSEQVEVVSCGSVVTAIAHLHGIAAEELRPDELGHDDRDYQVLITIRAVKPSRP